jgi:hypothetical protein
VKQKTQNMHWILMADVVRSGDSDAALLQEELKNCVALCNTQCAKAVLSPLAITLGDEFQGLAHSLKACVAIVTFIEETILQENLHFGLRWVIYFGKIDTTINTEIAYGMLGPGLSQAREQLGFLKNTERFFYIETGKKAKNEVLNEAFYVWANMLRKWQDPADRALVAVFLQYKDYKRVAEVLDKNRSQIWKRRNSLEINSYFAIKKIINYLI